MNQIITSFTFGAFADALQDVATHRKKCTTHPQYDQVLLRYKNQISQWKHETMKQMNKDHMV